MRAKALQALSLLPGHRLEALLSGGGLLERLVRGVGLCCCWWWSGGWGGVSPGAARYAEHGKAWWGAQDRAALWLARGGSAQRRRGARAAPPPSSARRPFVPQVVSLRSSSDEVRAAAVEAAGELSARERTLQLAAEAPGTLGALMDLWEGITDALLGEPCNGGALGGGEVTACQPQAMPGAALHPRCGPPRTALQVGCTTARLRARGL